MLDKQIIQRTLRVPRSTAPAGDGSAAARQMDAVLVGAGFKASRDLLEHVSALEPGAASDLAAQVVGSVRELVGDHVQHNSYFIDFPRGVPDTVEFWVSCLRDAFVPSGAASPTDAELLAGLSAGLIGLLDLPRYGRYQHTYAEMLAAHDELIPSVKDRVTVVHLGDSFDHEARALYLELAGSTTPLGETDRKLLAELAEHCGGEVPESMPVRENRAVINTARLAAGLPLVGVDTVVDVLRTACQASGGDVTLAEPSRFRSFTRRERRVLLAALDQVVAGAEGKLGDIARWAERFKRLGERLHPHEYPRFPGAQDVFAVARGERTAPSLTGRAELAFAAGDIPAAAAVLAGAPGLFMRSLDRLLRQATEPDAVLDAMEKVLGSVSGRVLCSVREHLINRGAADAHRVFVNRARRAWVAPDARAPLPREVIERASDLIDAELLARLPELERLVVDPAVLEVALPLSGAASEDGFSVLPRGSRSEVEGEVLRFFAHWRQTRKNTDFDLSAQLLDAEFRYLRHVSWTDFGGGDVVYSGDLTSAPDGATEFIDIALDSVDAAYVVPQVDIYSGEDFNHVAESMFGWMTRDRAQAGAPFDARTVRARSDMRGSGRIALPVVFGRGTGGKWTATWLHLYLASDRIFNQLENNNLTTGALTQALVRREYLTVRYLVELWRRKCGSVTAWDPAAELDGPVTFLGLHRPEGLPAGSTAITPDGLVP
ncbi:hypothetical protein SAMN05421805_1011744 [Saccharopolyspora antimicrobica]|uniref:TerD domain-containing protein n=1 Tax=Saccharopolyspora antimicrobica TaxID=455193 RepID=A0A1I4U6M4_9PSEU|nr:TerD family protein [Saccharopolyspora antimicrobica]RKT88703.1 hypothetical protein ATL45_7142 [Saccharopolyspora antimicrobica]SFM84490.1 hypothetical protein SAMN05421805_1011744 [Saccharopolyspora antimicrobica]